MGIGTKVDEELFKAFQALAKKCGCSQRYSIHLAVRLCNDYFVNVLEEKLENEES